MQQEKQDIKKAVGENSFQSSNLEIKNPSGLVHKMAKEWKNISTKSYTEKIDYYKNNYWDKMSDYEKRALYKYLAKKKVSEEMDLLEIIKDLFPIFLSITAIFVSLINGISIKIIDPSLITYICGILTAIVIGYLVISFGKYFISSRNWNASNKEQQLLTIIEILKEDEKFQRKRDIECCN